MKNVPPNTPGGGKERRIAPLPVSVHTATTPVPPTLYENTSLENELVACPFNDSAILVGFGPVSSVPSITQVPLSTRLVSANVLRPASVQIPQKIVTARASPWRRTKNIHEVKPNFE